MSMWQQFYAHWTQEVAALISEIYKRLTLPDLTKFA